ncbi:protein Shroom2-like isoform X2 [Nerophis ophidion]|nr:protein Shroom2-like isoform X2 [Nerophis ophidion]XP_061745172.1 protein Shroom2-like isoform X2 [Nerophis ophidion]
MVDVVLPHTMPSESEVHVARCFLTKILRSSMRKNRFKGKNDSSSRPHTWHSSKLKEEESESPGRESTLVAVWQPKEPRSNESSFRVDQNNRLLLTAQHSPVNSMKKLERPAQPFTADLSSPTKYTSNIEALSGTQSRGGSFNCFSSGSSPHFLDPSLLSRKGTSIENIFFKGFGSGGSVTGERPNYLQALHLEGSWLKERNSSRKSGELRPSTGPLWQVPEKKPQSSPPSLPNDSFASTKVFPYFEGPVRDRKNHERSGEKLTESNKSHMEKEFRRSFTPLSDRELVHLSHSQPRPSKHFSLSSTDIRPSHYNNTPDHYSDERPACLAPPTNIQSIGSYYRSLQDLPMKESGCKEVWRSSVSIATTNPKIENSERNMYSSLVNKNTKPHTPYKENKNSCALRNVLLDHQSSGRSHCHAVKKTGGQTILAAHQKNKHISLFRLHGPWVPQEDHRISPLRTPLLHSLAKESRIQQTVRLTSIVSPQDVYDSMVTSGGKVSRRSDRYATALQSDVREKRAQLQKSCSAAALTCNVDDADLAEWKSTENLTSCSISSSNTYKEHLKEAQARVLKATSFQRRDLDPLGVEGPATKSANGRVRGYKRLPLNKRTYSFSEPDKIDKLGMDREHLVSSFDQMKSLEAKPTFSKPVKPVSKSSTDLNTCEGNTIETKNKTLAGEAQEIDLSAEVSRLYPPWEEVQQDQQRLGTFAEYQASWSKPKKTSEAKIKGRYYSAENILDSEAEAVCFHERSRSSPSADFHTQNSPSLLRNPQSKQRNGGNQGPVPGTPDYQTSHDPAYIAASSCPGSLGPPLDSQHPEKHPQANGVTPSKSHLGLETASPFLLSAGALENQAMVLGTQQNASTERATPADHLHFCRMPEFKRNKEEAVKNKKSASSTSLSLLAENQAQIQIPSPQFAPLRPTEKQPTVSMQEDSSLRSENDSKPPDLQIVQNENSTDVSCQGTIVLSSDMRWSPSSNTFGIFKQPADAIPLQEMPPASPSVCSQQPTEDLGQGSNRGNILELGLTGEEAKRDQLVKDIMGKDKSLVEILDHSGRKTTMDLMEGIFPSDEQILQRRRTSNGSRLPITSRREEDDVSAASSLVPSSSYYNTSAPKAELLIKMKDMQEQLQESEDELDVDLASKKHKLISSLAKKLEVLREARHSLQEDVEDNEALGLQVETTVQRLCLPNQLDKFRMFVGDLDKVVSLLLSLSGRLARVENALNSLEDEAPPEEKRTLAEKRKVLIRQHEDAKELKENLDRRERLVSAIMEDHLDTAHLDDYRHFVKMKSALIIEQRKLEDKIKLGEEQLKCLLDSLPLEQRPWL